MLGLQIEYDALNVRVSNNGQGVANVLAMSVEGPWESTVPPVGDLTPGETKDVSVHIKPTSSGRVRIIFRIQYTDADGPQKLVHHTYLPVSNKEEATTPILPDDIYRP